MSTGQIGGAVVGAAVGYVATAGSPYGILMGAQISAEISGFNDPASDGQQHRTTPRPFDDEACQE